MKRTFVCNSCLMGSNAIFFKTDMTDDWSVLQTELRDISLLQSGLQWIACARFAA